MPREPIAVPDTIVLTAYGSTLQPEKAGPRTFIPLACDVGETTVAVAVDSATRLVPALGLYPGDPTDVLETFARIEQWSDAHGIERLADLIGETVEALICELADVPDLTFAPPRNTRNTLVRMEDLLVDLAAARARAHLVRNCLIALRSATVLTRPRTTRVRTVKDNIGWGLPSLPSLEDRTSRPLTDAEIMLGRLLVEIELREMADPRPVIGYLFAETGVRTAPSTTLDTTNLDKRATPTRVTCPGVWEFPERTVEFDPYVADTLPVLTARLRDGVQRLTYDGEYPGQVSASNSLSATLTRTMRRAGIADPATTPKSLNFWRPFRALCVDADPVVARRYHGGSTKSLLMDLRLNTVMDRVSQGTVYLQRKSTGEILTGVKVADFTDYSVTRRRPNQVFPELR